MNIVRIKVNLGPGSTPSDLEAIVKAVRVSTDVGVTSTLVSLRRIASASMKFPTDSELYEASDRLAQEPEEGFAFRAVDLVRTRASLRKSLGEVPPDVFWRRGEGRLDTKRLGLDGTPYGRFLEGSLTPWRAAGDVGLDAIDPDLYNALVADYVAQRAPSEIFVRELTYRNPFGEELGAIGAGVEALKKAAGVVETVATLGSRRKIKRAEATVAEETIEDRIAMSRTERDLQLEQLRRARLENEVLEQQLEAVRIQNAASIRSLSTQNQQQVISQHFVAHNRLDEADAIMSLDPDDAASLVEFATGRPEIERSVEPDPRE